MPFPDMEKSLKQREQLEGYKWSKLSSALDVISKPVSVAVPHVAPSVDIYGIQKITEDIKALQ